MKRIPALFAACLSLLATTLPAQPIDDLAQVTVRPGWRTATGDHIAAIEITLKPGWLTYWRAPGGAGIPPQFSFETDPQIGAITPHWPTPIVSNDAGLRSIGYYDRVVFPLTIAATPGAQELSLRGEIEIGVCEEVCIPITLPFSGLLPAMGGSDPAIARALDAGAITAAAGGVTSAVCRIAALPDGLRVTAEITLPPRAGEEFVVIEPGDPAIWVSQAKVTREGEALLATVDMLHMEGGAFMLDRSSLRMTVLGGDRAVDIRGCAAG